MARPTEPLSRSYPSIPCIYPLSSLSLSLSSLSSLSLTLTHILVKTHNYINKFVWKTLLRMGVSVHNRVWSSTNYMGRGTCWIANTQDKHSTEERIFTCSNKEICHISTPFNIRRYAFTPCLPSNTKVLRMFAYKMHQYLLGHGSWSYVEWANDVAPDSTPRDFLSWEQVASTMLYCFAFCVSDKLLSYIQDTKTPKDTWANLKRIFVASMMTKKLQLR